ncbi:hypothetical protein [Croceivirga thetidis]|uniref:Intradiol ring-cleavage dioxygenases domain-containing protein n=1 Tax=Croceivirga thetidis TaxID=2721623 RepID=A0ABX1GT75_9FLAO|nr:hypothetical protein [Croceivirga thetidis]NKI31947.1 hypothetical protein [Croceivirga thetidis]
MKNKLHRRGFLKNSLAASGSLMLSVPLSAAAFPNTTAASKCDIRLNPFGKQLEISGKIFDASGKKVLPNTTLQFWHFVDDAKKKSHRGMLTTDDKGRYQIKLDYPSNTGDRALNFGFDLSNGAKNYQTNLKISEFDAFITGEHWEANNQLEDNLLFPKHSKSDHRTMVEFNISLNNQK